MDSGPEWSSSYLWVHSSGMPSTVAHVLRWSADMCEMKGMKRVQRARWASRRRHSGRPPRPVDPQCVPTRRRARDGPRPAAARAAPGGTPGGCRRAPLSPAKAPPFQDARLPPRESFLPRRPAPATREGPGRRPSFVPTSCRLHLCLVLHLALLPINPPTRAIKPGQTRPREGEPHVAAGSHRDSLSIVQDQLLRSQWSALSSPPLEEVAHGPRLGVRDNRAAKPSTPLRAISRPAVPHLNVDSISDMRPSRRRTQFTNT